MPAHPPPPPAPSIAHGSRWIAPLLLGVSLALRIALAAQGGQYYFDDEKRYDRGLQLYFALCDRDWSTARALAGLPEHTLFTWLGALVSAIQHGLAHLTPYGDWSHRENAALTMWIAAALLSLGSTLNLFLVHRLARALGAGRTEANWALLLMAASNTAFYYSRHLLPYECALAVALAAALVAVGRPTCVRAAIAGGLAGLVYGVYNGYWYLVPVLGLASLMRCRREPRRNALLLAWAASAAVALALPIAIGSALDGALYWQLWRSFSHSVTLGLFAEGWSLPGKYFWHAEGLLGVAIALAVLVASVRALPRLPKRVRGTLVVLAAAYGLLVLFSVGLERFVVYARTVKPFVPLGCLLGGWAAAQLVPKRPLLRAAVATAVVGFAAAQFAPHFTRVFPREIESAVLRHWGNPKRALAIRGSLYRPLRLPVTRPDLALVNAQNLYPIRDYIGFPAGRPLLHIDHPLTYPPFQYEGHLPREREILRTQDISIRLIQLAHPDAISDHPPRDQLYLPADFPSGH